MCKLSDGVANLEVGDLAERIEQYIDHSLRYACQSWHKHLIDPRTVPAHVPKITSVLHRFLEEKVLFWLEVLSVLGTVRDAVDGLEVAAKWLEVHRVSTYDILVKFIETKPRRRRLSTSSTTTSDSSPDSSRSSARPLHISITRPSLCHPECQSCGDCTNDTFIP